MAWNLGEHVRILITPCLKTVVKTRLLLIRTTACLALSAPGVAAIRDVINFGATPNDATDDTAAIQKALDAAAEGDTVSLPTGTFLVNRTLRVKSGVNVQGAATDLTILKFRGTSPAGFFDLSGTRKVELTGFTLDGDNNVNAHHGVFGHGIFRVTLVVWDDQGRGAIKERFVTVKPARP